MSNWHNHIQLSDAAQRVMRFMNETKSGSPRVIAKELEMPLTEVLEVLEALVKIGFVQTGD